MHINLQTLKQLKQKEKIVTLELSYQVIDYPVEDMSIQNFIAYLDFLFKVSNITTLCCAAFSVYIHSMDSLVLPKKKENLTARLCISANINTSKRRNI